MAARRAILLPLSLVRLVEAVDLLVEEVVQVVPEVREASAVSSAKNLGNRCYSISWRSFTSSNDRNRYRRGRLGL